MSTHEIEPTDADLRVIETYVGTFADEIHDEISTCMAEVAEDGETAYYNWQARQQARAERDLFASLDRMEGAL